LTIRPQIGNCLARAQPSNHSCKTDLVAAHAATDRPHLSANGQPDGLYEIAPNCRRRVNWDCFKIGVSGPITPGLMAWRERCRDDRDTG
jgi:hypothetical protein